MSKKDNNTIANQLSIRSQSQSLSSEGKEITGNPSINIQNTGKKIIEGDKIIRIESNKQIEVKQVSTASKEVKNQLIMRNNQNKDKLKLISAKK
jgi:hypothetical protein